MAWRIWLPCLILLVGLGLYQRKVWSGRLLLLTVASLVCFGGWIAKQDNERDRAAWAEWDARRVPLHEAVILDGLHLPAGTLVRWNTDDPRHIVTADLIGEQEVAPGVIFQGEVVYWHLWWRGDLVRDATLQGWRCKAGTIDIFASGKLRWCKVAGVHLAAGDVPDGTTVLLDTENKFALLHLTRGGMTVLPQRMWTPANYWIAVNPDGTVALRADGTISSFE